MEDIRAIYRIFNNLKYEMENNGWVYQWHLGDEPMKVTHKFNPPVTPEEFQLFEKYFPNMKLPASYKAFLSCSNGMELFCGEEGRDDYLCYPAPDTDRFNIPFNEWLERYIVCQGHEFWYFLNP